VPRAAAVALLLVSSSPRALAGQEHSHADPVTPAAGPIWLRVLSISVDETQLGHMGGDSSPRAPARASPLDDAVRRALAHVGSNDAQARKALEATFTADGAELYRLDCRSCHGPNGVGRPPEVASIIGPARALSPVLIEQNMRRAGRPARPDLAKQLAAQAEQSLRERLRDGGKRMPPFQHLSDAERGALVDYLKRLAGAPASEAPAQGVAESAARIGEHLVQGTCRVCHDATGPGAGHMMMMMGRIPALANIPENLSLDAVVHKVRHGWSGVGGMMNRMSRMPVFPYLSDEEVAAAYLYLAYYPPTR